MPVSALNRYSLRQWLEGPGAVKTAFWLAAVFLLLVTHTLAQLTWSFFDEKAPAAPIGEIVSEKTIRAKTIEGMDYSRVGDLHLFGRVVVAAKPPPPPTRNEKPPPPKISRINAKLIGILYSSNTKIARALISGGRGEETPYKIGDMIENSAKLEEIHVDHVIIMNGGKREKLELPEDTLNLADNDISIHAGNSSSSSSRSNNSRSKSRNNRKSNNRRNRNSDSNKRTNRQSARNKSSSSSKSSKSSKSPAELKSIRDDLVKNPAKISSLIRAFPYSDRSTGKFMGFRVTPGRDPSLFHEIGLRSGDIVVNLNGVELDSPTKGLQVMGNLATTSSISATVLRNGNMESVFFSFQ